MQARSEVQSLLRGLKVIEVINERPGARTAEIAVRCGIPRTSAHRMLTTLVKSGFVYRDDATGGYFAAHGVLRLSRGFDPAAQLAEIARGQLAAIAPQIAWPLHLSVPEQLCMRVQVATDHVSPFAVEKLLPGHRLPVLQCAAGLAYLASVKDDERAPIVEAALRQPCERPNQTRWTRPMLEAKIAETQRAGYALFKWPQRVTNMVGLSVPIFIDGRPQAALSVRFAETAVPVNVAISRFLPQLTTAASRLRDATATTASH